MDLSLYTAGLSLVFDMKVLLFIFLGTLLGIVTGALPGLSAMMGVSILIPLTYGMSPSAGILMLIGVYLGAVYGGSLSATLMNIPGTPSAVMTALDAYPLAKKGQAGRAIGISTVASALGGLLSVVALAFLAPVVADFALKFTSIEMFMIALFGISIMAYIAPGSMIKGLIAGSIGLLIATIGADPMTSVSRFTFGEINLFSGIQFVSAMIGLYGITEILLNTESKFKPGNKEVQVLDLQVRRVLPTWMDMKKLWLNISRSSIVGVIIGAIPGAGGTIASIVSYAQQKRFSNDPDKLGKGSIEGIAAAESANNACTGGAMITLLSLGIPGDAVTAILIGAFMIHGLVPGPLLFQQNFDIVSAIFIGMVVANLFLLVIGLGGARYFSKLLLVPFPILNTAILALCFLGTFAIQNNFFDIKTMLVFAILGFVFSKLEIPRSPLVLALILGPLMESNLRRFLSMSNDGSLNAFVASLWNHPIAGTLMILTALTLILPLFQRGNRFTEEVKMEKNS
ncbi:tripartite tricarboxylate transporter permease [Ammoniphilus sp. YIM 78166]|uniref:tripartite tricarboxylate transporter permease n=1 Tax=Ammoniphilus sp. YIM 78166 TaxID=1644106 RepID=UPI0010703BD6|nr:tripartite tricarboxylate transporter permease [Ammoniphilus sp. YIM 78166]